MTIDRRRLFGLGALGVGAAALEACAVPPTSPPSAREIERMLIELDLVLARLEAHDADPRRFGIRSNGVEIEAARQRCLALLRTLCFLGTYRDLPEEVWNEPGVAAHLERALPRIEATIAAAHEQLEALDEGEAQAIDDRLAREPDLPMHIVEIIDAQAKELGVPFEQRVMLRTSTAQLAHRYRWVGTREAARKIAGVYGRMLDTRLAELGIEHPRTETDFETARSSGEGTEPSALRTFLAAPRALRPGTLGEVCVRHEDCGRDFKCKAYVCSEPPKSKDLMNTARKLAIAGAWRMIPPACGVGVLILLQALFVVIAAGIIHAGED